MLKKWIFTGTLAAALSGILLFSYISAASPLDTSLIDNNLVEKGVRVSNISASGSNLQLELKSESSDKATPEDILALREIRNEIRKESNKNLQIQNVSLKIISEKGNTIYDGIVNDIKSIPDFSKKPEIKLDSNQVETTLTNELTAKGLSIASLNIADSPIGGKLANIVLTEKDADKVNDLIPQVENIITNLNDLTGTGIYQYNLSVEDGNKQLLIFLTTDLVYRDFYWWQSPILGDETWTKNSPKVPSETVDTTEAPAQPAPDPSER